MVSLAAALAADFIGDEIQAQDALLDAIAALVTANNKGLHFTGVNAPALHDQTAFGRTLAALADAAALRTAGGLIIGTDIQAHNAPLAAGYGGIWGDPIATANFSASPNVDFTGLSAYRELLLLGFGVAHADVANQVFIARLSDDVGSVYDATGYTNTGSSTTVGMLIANAIPTSTPIAFEMHLIDFNNAAYKTRSVTNNGREGSTAGSNYIGRYGTARVNDALRFTNINAVNLTAGEFLLYGRKG